MTETKLKLRSNRWASMVVIAPTGGYTAGQIVKVEDTVGVIVETVAVGKPAVLIYECEKIVVPKVVATGVTLVVGAKVYYDGTGAVTNESSGTTLCGRVLEAAGQDDEEVLIDLKGNVAA